MKNATLRDLNYILQKAGMPIIRGFIWQLLRFRIPNLLMLGSNIQFITTSNCHFGKKVFIGSNSYIETGAKQGVYIGDRVTIRENAWLQCRSGLAPSGEGLSIGDKTYIGPRAVIGVGGYISIGKSCQIGAGLTLSAQSHEADANHSYVTGKTSQKGIQIKDNCWFGNNVSILDGITVGEGCVIGANSLITKNVPANSVAYGVPAKVIREKSESKTPS